MLKIAKKDLGALFRMIAKEKELFVPQIIAGEKNWAVWDSDSEVDLTGEKTVKSAKDVFFPQYEELYTCKKEGKKLNLIQADTAEKDFVVFGMRECDIQGVKVLDNVFLSEPADSFYAARREHAVMVSLACNEPETSCFCKVFGLDGAEPAGDVAAYFAGDDLFWEAVTPKGQTFTESVKEMFAQADSDDLAKVEEEKKKIRNIIDTLPYSSLSLEGWDGDATASKFDSPVWEKLYKPCLGCGTCTFVCPTCQCYDIKDYKTQDGVKRYRCWDSCMYSDFTLMAAANSRTSQLQRFRQRFMHKLVYYPANNNGMYSCTGCGRCIDKCPQSLNIVKVIKAFEKEGGNE